MPLINQLSIPRALKLFPPKTMQAFCEVTDLVGKCVYVSGDLGGVVKVSTSNPLDGETTMPSIGIISEKSSDTECTVHLTGPLFNVVTGLTPGKNTFVAENGGITHTLVDPLPASKASIQLMGVALTNVVILVNPSTSITRRVA